MISIVAGTQTIVYPAGLPSVQNETALQEMVRQGIEVLSISKFENGRWQIHPLGMDFGLWPLLAGHAYAVSSRSAGTWVPAGGESGFPSPLPPAEPEKPNNMVWILLTGGAAALYFFIWRR